MDRAAEGILGWCCDYDGQRICNCGLAATFDRANTTPTEKTSEKSPAYVASPACIAPCLPAKPTEYLVQIRTAIVDQLHLLVKAGLTNITSLYQHGNALWLSTMMGITVDYG